MPLHHAAVIDHRHNNALATTPEIQPSRHSMIQQLAEFTLNTLMSVIQNCSFILSWWPLLVCLHCLIWFPFHSADLPHHADDLKSQDCAPVFPFSKFTNFIISYSLATCSFGSYLSEPTANLTGRPFLVQEPSLSHFAPGAIHIRRCRFTCSLLIIAFCHGRNPDSHVHEGLLIALAGQPA